MKEKSKYATPNVDIIKYTVKNIFTTSGGTIDPDPDLPGGEF